MSPRQRPESTKSQPQGPTHRVRLPGFLVEEETGLGDAIKRATSSLLGVKPCGGCEKRATILNQWMTFTR
jgi:hypothetical protein